MVWLFKWSVSNGMEVRMEKDKIKREWTEKERRERNDHKRGLLKRDKRKWKMKKLRIVAVRYNMNELWKIDYWDFQFFEDREINNSVVGVFERKNSN